MNLSTILLIVIFIIDSILAGIIVFANKHQNYKLTNTIYKIIFPMNLIYFCALLTLVVFYGIM